MGNNISLTASMRSNLLSLQNISRQVSSTQNKLATGNKVNSAIDNPSSYYTARSLNNRANDLDALLDSMGQAVSTIKAATTALETGATFLEQAAAVATSALETAQVPDVSWFAQQEDVAAVVTTKAELLDVLDTKIGNIVIYGHIDMGAAQIQLKDGQNLVGVGYFATRNANATDSELNKFSSLSFDLGNSLNDTAVSANTGSNILSDLTINVNFGNREKLTAITLDSGTIHNLNLEIQANSANNSYQNFSRGLEAKEEVSFTGLNNFRQVGQSKYFAMIHGKNINLQDANLNILTQGDRAWGVYSIGSTVALNLYGGSILSVNSDDISIDSININMYDNAQIFINQGFALGSINMHSSNNKIYSGSSNLYYAVSDLSYYSPAITMVEGATIAIGTGTYTAPAGGITDKKGTDPKDLTTVGLDKTSDDKASESDEYKQAFADFMTNKTSQFGTAPDYWATEQEREQYNQILQQYDRVIADGTYKGTNLLKKDSLKVDFNQDRTASLNITGFDASAAGLNLSSAQAGSRLSSAIEEIRQAVLQIRAFSAELGNNYSIITNRQEFTENLINILTEGADKLTLADMNEESANMLSLQTRQQLAINSLSLASQASQSILKLF